MMHICCVFSVQEPHIKAALGCEIFPPTPAQNTGSWDGLYATGGKRDLSPGLSKDHLLGALRA